MNASDEDLAFAAAGGDADAFAVLLERRYDTLFRLSFRLTGTRAEAEDLTHDICLALPRKLRGFRGEARFTTWLTRVAMNAAHDRRRRAASHGKAVAGWGEVEVSRRAEAADTADRLDWLTRAMAALPEALRDTAALILDDDLTHSEAAEVLGVSEGTVSWRLSEIRKRLREILAEEVTE